MFGMGGGGGPIDYLRSRVSSWQAHPFQNIASTAFGAMVPGGGFAANALFDRYNNNQFNNSASQLQDRSLQQTTMDSNSAMNAPLNGPLGAYDRNNPYGSNAGPAQTMGGPSGSPMGGGGMGPSSGYNGGYNTQNWNLGQMTSGNAPNQPSSFVNDILNSISTGPGQPGTQQGGLFGNGQRTHQQIQSDYRDGTANVGPGIGNYGVSNFNVGGSPVIFGTNGFDPNGAAVYNRRGVGY